MKAARAAPRTLSMRSTRTSCWRRCRAALPLLLLPPLPPLPPLPLLTLLTLLTPLVLSAVGCGLRLCVDCRVLPPSSAAAKLPCFNLTVSLTTLPVLTCGTRRHGVQVFDEGRQGDSFDEPQDEMSYTERLSSNLWLRWSKSTPVVDASLSPAGARCGWGGGEGEEVGREFGPHCAFKHAATQSTPKLSKHTPIGVPSSHPKRCLEPRLAPISPD